MNKIVNKILVALLATVLVFISSNTTEIFAMSPEEVTADGKYHVVDFSSGEDIGSFDAFTYAHNTFQANKDNYYNLGIVKDTKVYEAEHAIVLFNSSSACDVNVSYTNSIDGISGYTNGCYGKDGAYISTETSGKKVKFMLSGVEGWASISDVTIVPVESISSSLTAYVVNEGNLYHLVKSQMDDDNYASMINLGIAPAYLSSETTYYSYDGHYFYEAGNIDIMLDDYYNDIRDNAVNAGNPYYNYYQFVSHRTITNYDASVVEDYIENTMGIKEYMDTYSDRDLDSNDDTMTRSQLYKSTDAFWTYQYTYGANALMMLALSANETYFGHSSLSFTRNNLFGHAAYDSDVEANASRYLSVDHSIYSHAKYYISGSYASPLKYQFHGSFFGNKANGMNVAYASDPYWGEKAASYYYMLDNALGLKDLNAYTLGIKTSPDTIYIYQYPEEDSKVLYDSGKHPDMAFVILGYLSTENGDYYKVQCEATLNADSAVDLSYNYDFQNNVGYIKTEDIQVVIDNNGSDEKSFVHVTFDAGEGSFSGDTSTMTYALPASSNASFVVPTKDHAIFTGWDISTEDITEDTVFTAQYKDVSSIEMKVTPQTEYEVNDRINLENGVITVNYADGTTEDVDLNTSMVYGFNFDSESSQEVAVSYAGCTTSYTIHVSEEKDATRTEIKDSILSIIERYQNTEELTDWDLNYLLSFKQKIDENVLPYLTQIQLRSFDAIMRKAIGNSIRYVIEKNDYNLGVSGLSVSVPLSSSLSKPSFLADTYRVRMKHGISSKATDAMEVIANFLGTTQKDAFSIRLRKNFSDFSLDGPVLFSIKKPDDATDAEVYTVLYYNKTNGDVEKCYTRQTTNTITFMGSKDGEYMLVSRNTSNIYIGDDPVESVTVDTSSYDLESLYMQITVGLIALILLGVLLRRFLVKKNNKNVAKRREKKEIEKAQEPLPPVDVTQALEIFDTEVLDLDKIRELDEEHQRRIHKHD